MFREDEGVCDADDGDALGNRLLGKTSIRDGEIFPMSE